MRTNHIAIAIDDGDCRPRTYGVGSPHSELPVVHDRVLDLVAQGRLANPGRLALRDIFAAMHSDHDQVGRKPLFDLPQLRKDVNAVYSAVRPEIEEDNFASQTFQCEGMAIGVYPIEARWKFGRSHSRYV